MSVTIVSALAKPAQTTAADNTSGNDSAAVDQGFASILFSQLVLPTLVLPTLVLPTLVLPTLVLPTIATVDTVASDPLPVSVDNAEVTTDTAPTDALALLSSLGLLAPPEQAARPDVPLAAAQSITGKGDRTPPDALAPPQPTLPGSILNPNENAEAAAPGRSALTGIEANTEPPARFAVPATALPAATPLASKAAPTELTADHVPALNTNTASHSTGLPTKSDAELSVQTPMRNQNWAGDFGQKIVWLATSNKQSAQLTLNPAQMGPIEISLNLEKGHASASFVSANADVREAIETALPRLREMFASAGIELGQANVSAESFRQQPGSGKEGRSASQGGTDNAILGTGSTGPLLAGAFATQRGNGLVDTFA